MPKCLGCYEAIDDELSYHPTCAQALFGVPLAPELPYHLEELADLARQSVDNRITIPGVQPKLSLGTQGVGRDRRLTIVNLCGTYIFKPPITQYAHVPENEDLTMHMARHCGIEVVRHGLIPLLSGELAYISRRCDRRVYKKETEKIHMEDLCQLTQTPTASKYKVSTEKMAKAVYKYSTAKGRDMLRLFELLLFSFLVGNADIHLKNFSLYTPRLGWTELSPAYDVLNTKLIIPDDTEDMALTIAGKKSKLKRAHFEELAEKHLGIQDKVIQHTIGEMLAKMPELMNWIDKSFLSLDYKDRYKQILDKQFKRLS